ncbi:MAG: TolC family protein [Candidatus Mucispirillum faecigallinarum]|nr:TolC family protein [Candidatus Mucispirillum faecigallinarum]
MFKQLILIIAFAVIPLAASALTIDETVTLALDTNNMIKSKQYTVKSKELTADNAILIFMPSVGVSYDYSYSWTDKTKAANTKTNGDLSTLSAYVNLNLFNGLSDLFNYQIAKLDENMAVADLDTTSYQTVLDAQTAFINVLKAKSDLEVADSNLKLLEMQKRDAQISADNGLIAKNDLLQTETYLASAKLQKITAQSAVTTAIQSLERVMNRKLDPNEELIEPVLMDIALESEEVLKDKMFANRSDLKNLMQSYEKAKKTEMKALSGVYPTIDASFNYAGYGDSADPFAGNPNNMDSNMTVAVTASWNILSVASSSLQSIASKRTRQALAYSIADTKQSMILDLQTKIENYYTSKAQLIQSIISVQHAEENYRVTKNLYDQSAATMTELLDASSMLNEAKMAESTARYSVLTSVYNLEWVIQEKLPVHEVQQDNGTTAVPLNQSGGPIAPVEKPVR